jgi:potassium-transporting ATPase KdpC subunit
VIRNVLRALIATIVLAVVTGIVYPAVMTGIAQVAFKGKANGSLVSVGGVTVGSSLIGQQWTGPQWFYGRPSAISSPFDASTSSGSNLGPTSKALAEAISQRVSSITNLESPYHPGLRPSQIPVDLLTASASGLDPDISPAAAEFQAARIAAARHVPLEQVLGLIRAHTKGRSLGFLGEPLVNVLELNLALQSLGAG